MTRPAPSPATPASCSRRRRTRSARSRRASDAGGFTAREYAVIKERVVPFCRAQDAAAGDGDVRLPGRGTNVYFVYTPAEAAALRTRCGALMQALAATS